MTTVDVGSGARPSRARHCLRSSFWKALQEMMCRGTNGSGREFDSQGLKVMVVVMLLPRRI